MGGNYEKSIYNQLMDVMARLDSVENNYKRDVSVLNNRIDELSKENDSLKKENKILKEDNARLKSILNNDSSNTSLPPSSDNKNGKPANTYNGRKKTDRKAGGQKGHKGTTLTKAKVEEKIKSGRWKVKIEKIGGKPKGGYIKKYVLDLQVVPLVKEIRIFPDKNGQFHIPQGYRSDVTYGENVKALAIALYSEGVMANDRIAAFLNAASGNELGLSSGSVYGFCKRFSDNAKISILHLEKELLNKNVVATDATTATVNGTQNYIRNFSTEMTVVFHTLKKKTISELKQLEFLNSFGGILVHDHETALYHFGTGHGECNVHLIRYLRKNSEETKNQWSDKMIKLLCVMNSERKELISQGIKSFSEDRIKAYEKCYMDLIAQGRCENKQTKHKYAKSDEKTLLNRMEKYKENHLLFLHNFEVWFDDNISERDLRKAKNRQKMAGGFRKDSGHEMYCSILTIIETLKRRNMNLIENIKKLFVGTPAIF